MTRAIEDRSYDRPTIGSTFLEVDSTAISPLICLSPFPHRIMTCDTRSSFFAFCLLPISAKRHSYAKVAVKKKEKKINDSEYRSWEYRGGRGRRKKPAAFILGGIVCRTRGVSNDMHPSTFCDENETDIHTIGKRKDEKFI